MTPSALGERLSLRDRLAHFFALPLWREPRTLLILWTLLPIVAAIAKMSRHNNFLIFRHVYWHVVDQLPLYELYPNEYFDYNHYGPAFSVVVAPFALFPAVWGHALWLVALSLGLYFAVRKLPIRQAHLAFIYWFCAHELLTALFMQQFNIAIAAIIVGTFVCIEREREGTAAFLIMMGTFVKLYGIVGLSFFFFSQHRMRFIGWLIFWAVFWFAVPMLLSSPDYIISQYMAWVERLGAKNLGNQFSLMQNISLLGMIRKISGVASYSDLMVIIPGLVLFGLPYLRVGQYRHVGFRYALLSSVLLFVVLFSTGSESSTYIIPFVGIALWYVSAPWTRSKWDVGLMIFAFILSSMSPSDLFPAYLRNTYIIPYALKALPCTLIWLRLIWEMLTRNYNYAPPVEVQAVSEA